MEISYHSIVTGIFSLSGVIIGAILTFLQWFKNRRRLTINASVMMLVLSGYIGEKNIYVNVANSSPRPIHVVMMGLNDLVFVRHFRKYCTNLHVR